MIYVYLLVGLGIIFGFACLLGLFHALETYCKWRALQKLISQGKAIEWEDALECVLSGKGRLVHNTSSLPGKLWWIPLQAQEDYPTLFDEVADSGLVVISISCNELKRALKDCRLIGKIFTLSTDPFCSERANS